MFDCVFIMNCIAIAIARVIKNVWPTNLYFCHFKRSIETKVCTLKDI